jgi:hypothetical protein
MVSVTTGIVAAQSPHSQSSEKPAVQQPAIEKLRQLTFADATLSEFLENANFTDTNLKDAYKHYREGHLSASENSIQLGQHAPEYKPYGMYLLAQVKKSEGQTEKASKVLSRVALAGDLDSRLRLIAWANLRRMNVRPPADLAQQVLGVVLEVKSGTSTDILSAYNDRSARYFNYSGAAVIWEKPDNSLDALTQQLISDGQALQGCRTVEDRTRELHSDVRVSLLTPGGICELEARWTDLQSGHSKISRLFGDATRLQQAMIQKETAKTKPVGS